MNFIESYRKGQAGQNRGLYMGDGLFSISNSINGIQKGMTYGVGASPKAGKTTLADYGFIIEPYLDSLNNNIEFEVIYNSYEIDRISKEFDFASHFLNRDYGIYKIELEDGKTKDGNFYVTLSSKYLRGRLLNDDNEVIKVDSDIEEKLKKVYENRIIPIFGEYSNKGKQIKKGVVQVHENRQNPTGIRSLLLDYANENGEFNYEHFTTSSGHKGKKIIGYEAKNPSKTVLVVTDHLRKISLEKINGNPSNLKQCIDKYLEYCTEIRNICNFSFLHIIHLNRNIMDPSRIRDSKDLLFPSGDDVKDSGNLSEECDFMFTMFNPNDEKYNLTKHFGTIIKDENKNELYPNMRTIHLVENRHGDAPEHFRVEMEGGIKKFRKLEIK